MNVLVTGGTGFIGAQVVKMLVEEKKKVTIFDLNPATKLLESLEGQLDIIRGDLGNASHVMAAIKKCKPQTIYHLGGMLSKPSEADHAASFRANAIGTFNILEAARFFDVAQVLFSSTIATYGYDNNEEALTDFTLQRPMLFYGCTKVFGEHLGLFYKRKFGIDFRGLRYPGIVGPGVRTPGVAQYTSWAIEESYFKRPFVIKAAPETRCPVMYYKDSAKAIIQLGNAPLNKIKRVNYLVTGIQPAATAAELATIVHNKIPGAEISLVTDPDIQPILDKFSQPIDDTPARDEWGWSPSYNQEQIVDDFIVELEKNLDAYN